MATETTGESASFSISNISIGKKIGIGFGIILFITVLVSGFGYFGFTKVNHDVDEYVETVKEASIIAHIEAEFLKLRSHAREYAATHNEADAKAVHEIAARIVPLLDEADQHLVKESHREDLRITRKDFEIYVKDFKIAGKLGKEFEALVHDRLEPDGVKMVADLEQILNEVAAEKNLAATAVVSKALEHSLLTRLYSNIAIGRHDVSFAAKTEEEFAKMEALLAELEPLLTTDHERELLKEAKHFFEDYRDAYKLVRKDSDEINHLVNGEMKAAATEIAEKTEGLQKELAALEEEIEHKTKAEILLAEIEMLVAAGIGLVAGFVLAVLIGRAISNPVVTMTGAMEQLAGGNLEVEIPATDRHDEIGKMAKTVQVFRDNTIRARELEAEAEAQKLRAAEERKAVMLKMADDFESSVGDVVDAVSSSATELQATAQSMSAIAEETSSQTTAVAAASEEANANVQTVAAATEELASSISEIGRQVATTSTMAKEAVDQANETRETVDALIAEAQKIDNVVKFITDIAEQTNLLALNATIEAARAGDAGKGFAVVASEVKNLATQTTKATDEISTEIAAVQDRTRNVADVIERIGKRIVEMEEIATAVASAVEQQRAATEEIAANVEQAATGTGAVSENVAGLAQASQETGAASGQVLSASSELSQNSGMLKSEVGNFVGQIRSDAEKA